MNITLIYNDSKFNVDILNDTTCQYLYNIANKIFRLPFSQFRLVYKETEIENNSRLIFSVLSQIDPDNNSNSIIIRVESVPLPAIQSQTSIPTRSPSDDIKTESGKTKKNKGDITLCQICNYKNSIYYCRVCNLFVCFECNVRYNEHKNHDKINLEDGDAFLGCDVYREEIIKDINIIELGFKQTQQWMIDNTDREAFLQGLFKSLEYIRSHSLSLADMKTMYSLDQEMINDFKTEVDKIQVPKNREEIFESFNNLNLKENELRNYTKFLNLQIIKTEYNKVLLRCLDKVKQNMDQLGAEVKARLAECEEIKFRNINDIKLYLKEYGFKKKQNDIDNFLAKNYVPKEKNDKLNNEDNNEEEADDDDNNENENNMSDEKNNIIILNPVSGTNKKSNLKKNLLTISGAKFDKNRNLTLDKRLKGLKLKHDKVKNKFKLKELINNFTISSLPKKKELLVPLKIKKSINLKKNETVNELSNIAKPKNLKKFLFNTKQELSEADFQDFPLNLKKKEKDIEKITKSPNRKNESDDNDLDNKLNAKSPINLKNIDFSGFIGQEKKISFMSPSRGRNNLYRKSIVKKTKTIFDNI